MFSYRSSGLPSVGITLLPPPAAEHALRLALGPSSLLTLPPVSLKTPAGFPSPAADFECDRVDLLERLELDKPYVFMTRVRGQSMTGRGIDDGDLIVINRKVTPRHGHIVVAVLDNELTCKTLHREGDRVRLVAANPDFPDIVPKDGQELVIWGVVTSCIKSFGT
ncbi:LexA family protein [Tepidimonas taiwanensis]|uniref:LexA family protein n=1 Tax=Tepidimonas taiwanensis TaxID=307486 RepID=UPI0009DF08C2|nr:S24 family peptidase [Tepidimonas taiwanensis]